MSELTKVCDWEKKVDSNLGEYYYLTSCSQIHDFPIGGLKENPDFKFCPYCGGPIKSDDA